MHVVHNKIIDCSAMPASECSDRLLTALGHGVGFKLKADTPNDIVHGSVTIAHNLPPEAHEITVEIYEVDEAPTVLMVHGRMEGRESTLKRPAVIPTEQVIKDRINAIS